VESISQKARFPLPGGITLAKTGKEISAKVEFLKKLRHPERSEAKDFLPVVLGPSAVEGPFRFAKPRRGANKPRFKRQSAASGT
jgi:hypothetical protein